MSKRIVLALGGNAILQPGQQGTFDIQKHNVDDTTRSLKALIDAGNEVVIVHGNGPQVGQILQQNELSRDHVPVQPLHALVAESQGYIGYILQESIKNSLPDRQVVSLLTMVEVDPEDEAFLSPSKPVGMFYSEQDAKLLEAQEGWIMGEDAGRGYRRLVPSPRPKKIVEKDSILSLLSQNQIVISAGGGGIPVAAKDGTIIGIDAVVDKDLSALQLALDIDADLLMILTDVPNVYVNYNKPDEKALHHVSTQTMRNYIEEGQFSKGSMAPKVEACVLFAEQGGTSIICALTDVLEALDGEKGTRITRNGA